MAHHKFHRVLIGNGIDPNRATILSVEQKNLSAQIIYVEFEGIQYRIDGFTKTVVENSNKNETWNVSKNDVKKPRGWHFRDVFVDSEGNVYHKGIEQPELKGTLEQSI
jgi:hypothetical protein